MVSIFFSVDVSMESEGVIPEQVLNPKVNKKKGNGKPIYMIVFDCELTGPNLCKNALINLAAVCVNSSSGEEFASIDLFISPAEGKEWDEKTVEDFWNKQDHLLKVKHSIEKGEGKPLKQAIKEFVDFLTKCYQESKGEIFIAADHSDVDCSWVNQELCNCGYPPLHLIFGTFNPIISLYSYYLGLSQHTLESWTATKKLIPKFSATEAAMKHLQLRKRSNVVKYHLALADAKAEVYNYRMIAPFLQHMKRFGNHNYWFQTFCRIAHQTFIPSIQLSSTLEFPPISKPHVHPTSDLC